MILLSDVLGISALVDAINNSTTSATESSVLGPFHNEAHGFEHGQSIASKGAVGEPMLIRGTVKSSTDGKGIPGVSVDVWETNGNGFYDMQDPQRDEPDCRGIFHTDTDGKFALVGVRSVDYPIPSEGPVGDLLRLLNRTNIRPAHVVSPPLVVIHIVHMLTGDFSAALCTPETIVHEVDHGAIFGGQYAYRK